MCLILQGWSQRVVFGVLHKKGEILMLRASRFTVYPITVLSNYPHPPPPYLRNTGSANCNKTPGGGGGSCGSFGRPQTSKKRRETPCVCKRMLLVLVPLSGPPPPPLHFKNPVVAPENCVRSELLQFENST